jgi:hypothetical protein
MKKLLFILAILLISSCEILDIDYPVKYEVTCEDCPSGFDVTFTNKNGVIAEKYIPLNNWEYQFDYYPGRIISVIAKSEDKEALLTIKVYMNGKLIEESTNFKGHQNPYTKVVKKL